VESKLIIRIVLWGLNILKTFFYSPVVVFFAAILFIILAGMQESGLSQVSAYIIHLIFPREGSYDGGDIVAKYGLYMLISSLAIACIGMLTGKKFEIRRKKLFWILAIASALGWVCASIIMYLQSNRNSGFLWIGPAMFVVHLFFIGISMAYSYFVEVAEIYANKAS